MHKINFQTKNYINIDGSIVASLIVDAAFDIPSLLIAVQIFRFPIIAAGIAPAALSLQTTFASSQFVDFPIFLIANICFTLEEIKTDSSGKQIVYCLLAGTDKLFN